MVTKIVKTYLDYLYDNNIDVNKIDISETLRHSLCIALGLQSRGSDEDCYVIAQALKPPLNELGVYNKSDAYKQGILEACMHHIEATRKAGAIY